jgi:hypothetical protein
MVRTVCIYIDYCILQITSHGVTILFHSIHHSDKFFGIWDLCAAWENASLSTSLQIFYSVSSNIRKHYIFSTNYKSTWILDSVLQYQIPRSPRKRRGEWIRTAIRTASCLMCQETKSESESSIAPCVRTRRTEKDTNTVRGVSLKVVF